MDEEKLTKARTFCTKVKELASLYDLEFFLVTEGASICHIKSNEAVRNARKSHEIWEKEHNFNPEETWEEKDYQNIER